MKILPLLFAGIALFKSSPATPDKRVEAIPYATTSVGDHSDKRARVSQHANTGKASDPINSKLQDAISKMQKQYETTKNFRANFTQRFTYTMLRKTQESTGFVAYMKPGRIRWDYASPKKKSFVVNDGKLWVNQPEDKLVMVDHCFKTDTLTASLSFLWGAANLNKEFDVDWFQGVFGAKGDLHLLLLPKTQQNLFAKLILVLDKTSFRVKQSIVVDPQGNINQFIYHDAKYNQQMSKKDFSFKPPPTSHVSRMPGSCPGKTK